MAHFYVSDVTKSPSSRTLRRTGSTHRVAGSCCLSRELATFTATSLNLFIIDIIVIFSSAPGTR